MMMKKMIASAAVFATLVGSAAPALAAPSQTTETGIPLSAPISGPDETAADGQATEVQTTEDQTTEDQTTEDQTAEDQTAEDQTAEDQTAEDQATEDQTTQEQTADEETAGEAADELIDAGLTPDQFFYFLKIWIEQARVAMTRHAADKASLLQEQAQVRLAEALEMAEAGKADLAEKALNEAQAKLIAAARAIEKAEKTGENLSELAARIEADQAKYTRAVERLLGRLPEEVREELEPATTDLLIEVAVTQDQTAPAEEVAEVEEEAEAVAEEAGLKEEMAQLQPRKVLVLKAMAELSGKDLNEIYERYLQNPGLGRMAKELGLKMGAIQHAAQAQWKLHKADEAPAEDVEGVADTDKDLGKAWNKDWDDDRDDDRDDDDDDRDDDRDDDDDDRDHDRDDDDDDHKAGGSNGKAKGLRNALEKVSKAKTNNGKAWGRR